MTCQWCGDKHDVDRLCQRAQQAMTRRSFCFLFGASLVGAMTHQFKTDQAWTFDDVRRVFNIPPRLLQPERIITFEAASHFVEIADVFVFDDMGSAQLCEVRSTSVSPSSGTMTVTVAVPTKSTPPLPPQRFSRDAKING